MSYGDLLRIRSAAQYAGVSRGTIYRWLNQGVIIMEGDVEYSELLPYMEIDEVVFIDKNDLDKYLALLREIDLRD